MSPLTLNAIVGQARCSSTHHTVHGTFVVEVHEEICSRIEILAAARMVSQRSRTAKCGFLSLFAAARSIRGAADLFEFWQL